MPHNWGYVGKNPYTNTDRWGCSKCNSRVYELVGETPSPDQSTKTTDGKTLTCEELVILSVQEQ